MTRNSHSNIGIRLNSYLLLRHAAKSINLVWRYWAVKYFITKGWHLKKWSHIHTFSIYSNFFLFPWSNVLLPPPRPKCPPSPSALPPSFILLPLPPPSDACPLEIGACVEWPTHLGFGHWAAHDCCAVVDALGDSEVAALCLCKAIKLEALSLCANCRAHSTWLWRVSSAGSTRLPPVAVCSAYWRCSIDPP